ncbi:MAG TPA: transaminase [Myxococcota bacterium]
MSARGIDPARVAGLLQQERKAFAEAHPRSVALRARARAHMPNGVPMAWMAADNDVPVYVTHARGARFEDVDGCEYLDTNVADMSSFCGYANPPIVEAVARRAAQGTQFLLPTEDAIWVAEELARRYPVAHWQFTLSASQANTEAIRVARAATGRQNVLFFDGHYHGHFDEGTVQLERGELRSFGRGLPRDVARNVRVVPFNDARAVRDALEPRDVAIVLTEPALTNNLGLQLPEPGFHDALRGACSDTGTVLAYDETHTHVVGPGGCTALWGLSPDVITIGKSVAGGVPLGAYGMIGALADELEASEPRQGPIEVATGGTLFGNPLSMAAARAALGEVLVPEAYAHANALGAQLADGLERAIREAGLSWTAHRFGPRSGTTFAARIPRNAEESRASFDRTLFRLLRVWLGNRGVWEAIVGAGPTLAVSAAEADVDCYVDAYREFLAAVAG